MAILAAAQILLQMEFLVWTVVFRGLAVAPETSNVCVHQEKERERMKCSLSNIEGLSAEIENLGSLGPEELDQTWRDLFDEGLGRHDSQCALPIEPAAEPQKSQAGWRGGPSGLHFALLVERELFAQEEILGRERAFGS